MKYFICPCFYKSKFGCGIISIDRLIKEKLFDYNYLIIAKNACCYVCCKETIAFLFECYRESDIASSCANVNDPLCCIDLTEFGYENLCDCCEKLLCSYFSLVLIEIKYEP